MKRQLMILAATLYMGMAPSAAYAHHSHPYFYDQCKSVTIEGRVESVQWKDPHTWIVVRVDDGTSYTVDWNGLTGLTRQGVIGSAKQSLTSGVRVAVTGNPIRDTAQIREHFPDFKSVVNPRTIDPRSIRRADGGFNWALPPATNLPDCSRK